MKSPIRRQRIIMRLNALSCLVACTISIAARGDLVSFAYVGYGNLPMTSTQQYGTSQAAASLSYTSPGSFLGEARATAAYGRVAGFARASTETASYELNRAVAEARFSDLLTVSGPNGSGFVVYEYQLFGRAEGDEADLHLFLQHEGEPDEELAGEVTSGDVFFSLPHSVTFGTPFRTGLSLQSQATMLLNETGEAVCDFSFGAFLTGFSVLNAQMEPVASFSIDAASGTQYPLPAPGGLSALAAAGVFAFRRRRCM